MTEIDPRISRSYREISTESPSPALDAAIIAAANKRASTQRRSARSSRFRWMLPASVLATLVLGVSITLRVEREQPQTSGDTAVGQSPPRSESLSADRAAPAAAGGSTDSARVDVSGRRERPTQAAPARTPAPRHGESVSSGTSAASVGSDSEKKSDSPVPSVESTPAARSASEAVQTERPAKLAGPRSADESNAPGTTAAQAMKSKPAADSAGVDRAAPMHELETRRSPEVWLAQISRLEQEGRVKEAAEQLAEFRKAYPAYPIPERSQKPH